MTDVLPAAFFGGGAPGFGELLLVFVAALLLFGARKLPTIARNLGRAMEEFRRAARQVSHELTREESEADDSIPALKRIEKPVIEEETTSASPEPEAQSAGDDAQEGPVPEPEKEKADEGGG